MLDAAISVDERADERERSQDYGVDPDERGEYEIRAQTTGPTVTLLVTLRQRAGPSCGFRFGGGADFSSLFFWFGGCGGLIQYFLSAKFFTGGPARATHTLMRAARIRLASSTILNGTV